MKRAIDRRPWGAAAGLVLTVVSAAGVGAAATAGVLGSAWMVLS